MGCSLAGKESTIDNAFRPGVPGGTQVPPVATNLAITTSKNTSASSTFPASDRNRDALTYSIVAQGTKGTVTLTNASTGAFLYVPNSNEYGTDSFTWKVNDGLADSNVATVTVTINNTFNAPVATSVTPASFNEDTQSGIITLSYTDPDGDQANACATSNLQNVTVTSACSCSISGICTVRVTGTQDYFGAASFDYTVTAGGQLSNTASASLTINAVDDAPVATGVTVAAFDEDVESGAIALAYSDVEGDQASSCAITGVSHVSLTTPCACSSGVCTAKVTGAADYFGAASFTYTVTAGGLTSAPGTASLTINPVNDAPTANAQTVSTNEDIAKAITLSGNDVEGDTLTYSIVTGPSHGVLSGSGASRTYTPAANYSGPDSFTFKVNDGSLDSTSATVSITVNAVNDAPVAGAQSVSTNEDTATAITLSATDVEGDTLTYSVVSGPSHGTLSGTAPNLTYTPTANYNGSDSFTFKANDGSTDSNTATVSISVVPANDAPVSFDQATSVDKNVAKALTLGVTDVDGDALTYTIVAGPSHGVLSGSGANRTFTPTTNYVGSDSFTFKVNDGSLDSNTATVTLVIGSNNTAPVAVDQSVSTNEDTAKAITLSASDAEGDTLTYGIVSGPSHGVLSGSGASRTYTPTANYNGSDSFTFKANDGSVDSNIATVTITVVSVNDAPVSSDQSVSTPEDTAKAITLSASDVDGDALTYSIVAGPGNGILSGSGANRTYTPNANYNGPDSFTFKANDATVDSNTSTVSITVTAVDDPPIAANIAPAAFNEDTQSGLITLSYTDAESDQATSCTISNTSNVSVTQACACASGVCTLKVTGGTNYNGTASFDYTVTANGNTSNTATATLTITAVNDAPVMATIADTSTNEDTAKAVSVTVTDVDSTLACSTANLSMSSSNTTLVPNANVVWSGTAPNCTGTVSPAANQYGAANLTFTVTDGALTASRTFALTVVRQADDSWTSSWPFDALSDALHSISNANLIDLSGGVARLTAKDQTDDDSTCTGFGDGVTSGCGGSYTGTAFGTLADGSTQGLKLSSAGGCNGTTTNCANTVAPEIYELNSSWTPQWANLVSYWKMNGNWNDSKGSNNGTAIGTPTFSSGSKLGSYAGAFNGSNQSIGSSLVSSAQKNITMMAWFKSSAPTQAGQMIFFNGSDAAGNGYGFSVNNESSSNGMIKVLKGAIAWFDTGKILSDSNWHHGVLTLSTDGTPRFYFDGVLVYTGTSGLPNTPTAKTEIARNDYPAARYFNGSIDEVAFFSTDLTANEVAAIYDRQSVKYAGTFTSRLMDIGASSSWTSLNWFPTLPFMKELPDAACSGATCTHANSESSANYPFLVGSTGNVGDNDLMSGIVGLWHFNEATATAGANNDFKDDSGNGNHAEQGGTVTFGASGKLGRAVGFNGSTDFIQIPDSNSLDVSTAATFSAWIYPRSMATHTAVFEKVNGDGDASYMLYVGTGVEIAGKRTFRPHIRSAGGAWRYGSIDFDAAPNNWYHVVYTYESSSGSMLAYVNGDPYSVTFQSAPVAGETIRVGTAPLLIGKDTRGGLWFNGQIDEVGIWNRALTASEVRQLYQRGASRAKFQVRACNSNPCNESTETWKGPDGTSGSYFSELNNNTVQLDASGDVKKTLPSMTLSGLSGRYFQYRAILETDSSSASTLGPELTKVTAGPNHYDPSAPTIGNATPIDFQTLTSFTPNASCSSNDRYILSPNNGSNWYYYNGSAWTAADGTTYSQASTSDQINAGMSSLPASTGSLLYRAFLKSDGTSACSIDQLDLGGMK
jgi:hypothetical protein